LKDLMNCEGSTGLCQLDSHCRTRHHQLNLGAPFTTYMLSSFTNVTCAIYSLDCNVIAIAKSTRASSRTVRVRDHPKIYKNDPSALSIEGHEVRSNTEVFSNDHRSLLSNEERCRIRVLEKTFRQFVNNSLLSTHRANV
jgi:hypothetical protein